MSRSVAAPTGLTRSKMAMRAAQDIADQSYVNLGIGLPELIAEFIPPGRRVTYHSENGILGFESCRGLDCSDFDLINAGKKPIAQLPGTSFFHHADSFAMIRGGHIDLAILGAFQVASSGDIANWQTADDTVPAVGGAMDLVAGARVVWVITEHVSRQGKAKLVERCTFPVTGVGVVSRIYTDLAVIDVVDGRFVLREMVDSINFDLLQKLTDSPLHVEGSVKTVAPAQISATP